MDLRDLLDVKAICDTGSFRKAAQMLGVSQPTLSNRIAYLEGKLGAPLFDRERSRSRPTQLAEIIASRVAAIGQDTALLAKEIARLASGRTGVVRIGFGAVPARIILSETLARITTEYPELSVSLAFGSTPQLAEQLLKRDLDIVVSHAFASPHPAIRAEHVIEVGNIIVAHPKHAMFKGAEPSLSEIASKYPLAITVLEQRYLDIMRTEYRTDVNRLPGSVICADFELLIRLVASRPWYFTAGPAIAYVPELAAGVLRRLASPVPFNHRMAVHTNREALSLPAIETVRQIVSELFVSNFAASAVA
jgi:DNA-binding transcriptional LysR family regulator